MNDLFKCKFLIFFLFSVGLQLQDVDTHSNVKKKNDFQMWSNQVQDFVSKYNMIMLFNTWEHNHEGKKEKRL